MGSWLLGSWELQARLLDNPVDELVLSIEVSGAAILLDPSTALFDEPVDELVLSIEMSVVTILLKSWMKR